MVIRATKQDVSILIGSASELPRMKLINGEMIGHLASLYLKKLQKSRMASILMDLMRFEEGADLRWLVQVAEHLGHSRLLHRAQSAFI